PGGGLADEERALEVHPQHAVEIGLRQVEEIGAMDDAGIVDQDVEIAERAAGFGDHVLGVAGVADVGGHEAGLGPRARRRLPGGGVDVGEGDARTLGDVAAGDREPDAVRGAGDDRDLVLEPHGDLRMSVNGSTRTATVVPAKAGTDNHRLWNMGPQHKRVYARLRRAMRGDDNGEISGVRTADRE